jgi:hypothetical protein
MRPSFRTFLCLTPLALAAALCLLARGNWGWPDQQRLTDPWPLEALDQPIEEEGWWADRRAASRRRWEAKRQVTQALLDGRLTFRQAAARFRHIDAELPEARGWRQRQYTEEEWPYHQVISYVHTELVAHRRAPAQAEEWVARLGQEFREHFGHAPGLPPG